MGLDNSLQLERWYQKGIHCGLFIATNFCWCFLSDIVFLTSPSPYYYLLPGTLAVIPCLSVQQADNAASQITLNATFFRNFTAVNIFSPPPHHHVVVDSSQNVIGLVTEAEGQDSHTTYHCVSQGLTSPQAAVYVGGKEPHASPWLCMLGHARHHSYVC